MKSKTHDTAQTPSANVVGRTDRRIKPIGAAEVIANALEAVLLYAEADMSA